MPFPTVTAKLYSVCTTSETTGRGTVEAYLYAHTTIVAVGHAAADRRRFYVLCTTVEWELTHTESISERVEYLANYQNGRLQSAPFGASIAGGTRDEAISAACDLCPTVIAWDHNNRIAKEGCTRCECGCKYWEDDVCTDCGRPAAVAVLREWIIEHRDALDATSTVVKSGPRRGNVRYPSQHDHGRRDGYEDVLDRIADITKS